MTLRIDLTPSSVPARKRRGRPPLAPLFKPYFAKMRPLVEAGRSVSRAALIVAERHHGEIPRGTRHGQRSVASTAKELSRGYPAWRAEEERQEKQRERLARTHAALVEALQQLRPPHVPLPVLDSPALRNVMATIEEVTAPFREVARLWAEANTGYDHERARGIEPMNKIPKSRPFRPKSRP